MDILDNLKHRFDGITNLLTGAGMPNYDSSRASMVMSRRSLTREEQSRLLQYGFLRKIVSKLPAAATAKWGTPTMTEGDAKTIAAIATAMDKIKVVIPGELPATGVKKAIHQALFNAFLTGNGAIVIHTIGKKNEDLDLSQPIDLKNLKQIRKLVVLDRWAIAPDMLQTVTDMTAEITHFTINNGSGGRVHASRVLWIEGERLDAWGRQQNQGCDESILDGIHEVFVQYAGGIQGAARMLQDFDVIDIAVKGLWNMDKKEAEATRVRAQQNSLMQSLYRSRIRDMESEAITHSTRSVGGYSDLLEKLRDWMFANLNYSRVLFGDMPNGLNAGGSAEQEVKLWNDTIADLQSDRLTHQLTGRHADAPGLLDILCACSYGPTGGKTPIGLGWQWSKLYTPTPTEQADLEMNRAQLAATLESVYPGFAAQYINAAYTGAEFNSIVTLTPEFMKQLADVAALIQPPQPETDEFGNPLEEQQVDEEGAPIEQVPEEGAEELQTDSMDAIDVMVRRSVRDGLKQAYGSGTALGAYDLRLKEFANGGELSRSDLEAWRRYHRQSDGEKADEFQALLYGGKWGKVWANRN